MEAPQTLETPHSAPPRALVAARRKLKLAHEALRWNNHQSCRELLLDAETQLENASHPSDPPAMIDAMLNIRAAIQLTRAKLFFIEGDLKRAEITLGEADDVLPHMGDRAHTPTLLQARYLRVRIMFELLLQETAAHAEKARRIVYARRIHAIDVTLTPLMLLRIWSLVHFGRAALHAEQMAAMIYRIAVLYPRPLGSSSR